MGNSPPSYNLRPPPPPPRSHLLIPDAENRETAMVGATANQRSRPYYFKRCKMRKRLMSIESLSDDVLFNILVHLPAQDIYDSARFVCWKWYRMIHTHSFIYAHLHASTAGLVIQTLSVFSSPVFVSLRDGRFQISNFKYKFRFPIYSGWNGLILGFLMKDLNSVFILNPITNQNFHLPRLDHNIQDKRLLCIAYSAISMEYKVVIAYLPRHHLDCDYRLYILTVGVDKSWRHMDIQHLPPKTKKLFHYIPLVTEGFIHWAVLGYHVVTMNVETEIFRDTPVPLPQKDGGDEKRYTFYMTSGNDRLSLFIASGGFSWDVWEMKPATGEWTKLYNLDLESKKCEIEQLGFENVESLKPAKWLNYREAFFFDISGTRHRNTEWSETNGEWSETKKIPLTMYNLRTREIQILKLPKYSRNSVLIPHRNSLVWMAGS